jgi:hypothetical protein
MGDQNQHSGHLGTRFEEAALAASREVRDHRRRILEFQEKLAAEQRVPASLPGDRQLRMPLIGEVPGAKPPPPKHRRPRTKKPFQPKLGET